MTSQIRVDEITNRSGLGTVTIYDNGFEFTGVTTFKEDVDITGGLTIGGVLTYEDVTNIDSVGIVTARAGINISGGNLQVGGTNVINSGRVLYNLEQIKLADTKELVLGSGNDLKIQHSGSHSFISQEGVGALKIKGDDIRFEDAGGTEALRIDDVGRLLIGRTSVLASSAERLTIDDGMAIFRRTSSNAAALYIRNEDTTADTRQPYLIFTDGGGNRGGFGVQYNESSLWISGQNGIAFRTGGTAPSTNERLRITSDGQLLLGIDNAVDAEVDFQIHSATSGNGPILNLTNDTGDCRIFFGQDNSSGSANAAGQVRYNVANNYLAFYANLAERLRIDSSGNLLLKTGEIDIQGGNKTVKTSAGFLQVGTSGSHYLSLITAGLQRLNITSGGLVGINEASPTARLDINHPHTEQGLVVRSRYGNIATAMVKFDGDPDSNGGDGNVLHIHGGSSRTDSEILHIDSTGVGDIFDIRGDGLTRVYKQLQLEHSSNVAAIIFNEYGANDPKAQIEMDQVSGSSGQLIFRTQDSGTLSERLRITSGGDLVYDTNKGGIYNFDKACSANTSTNIFRIGNEHGAHCFTIYMTCSNSGNSVSKIYNVACQYGGTPTINSAADTGAYGSNNFSLTGSASGLQHTFAISNTGAAATISCTVVLGSMNTTASFVKL